MRGGAGVSADYSRAGRGVRSSSTPSRRRIPRADARVHECMREHGIDMPDPVFAEDGGVEIQAGSGQQPADQRRVRGRRPGVRRRRHRPGRHDRAGGRVMRRWLLVGGGLAVAAAAASRRRRRQRPQRRATKHPRSHHAGEQRERRPRHSPGPGPHRGARRHQRIRHRVGAPSAAGRHADRTTRAGDGHRRGQRRRRDRRPACDRPARCQARCGETSASGVDDGADVLAIEQALDGWGSPPPTRSPSTATGPPPRPRQWRTSRRRRPGRRRADHRGEIVFITSPQRVASVGGVTGQPSSEAAIQVTEPAPSVSVDVDARRRHVFAEGDEVTIELPDESTTPGTVASIGAAETDEQGETTLPVEITSAEAIELPPGTPVDMLVGVVSASGCSPCPSRLSSPSPRAGSRSRFATAQRLSWSASSSACSPRLRRDQRRRRRGRRGRHPMTLPRPRRR